MIKSLINDKWLSKDKTSSQKNYNSTNISKKNDSFSLDDKNSIDIEKQETKNDEKVDVLDEIKTPTQKDLSETSKSKKDFDTDSLFVGCGNSADLGRVTRARTYF